MEPVANRRHGQEKHLGTDGETEMIIGAGKIGHKGLMAERGDSDGVFTSRYCRIKHRGPD